MDKQTFNFSDGPTKVKFFCGMDVHKHQLEVAIYARDDAGREFVKSELFNPDPRGIEMAWNLMAKYRPVKFAMEATNVYHHVVATMLEEKKTVADWDYEILIVPPADTACLPGKAKNDVMPGLDGLETLKRVRQVRPSMKVVMITAYAHDDTVNELKKVGVEAILSKPIKFTELFEYLPLNL